MSAVLAKEWLKKAEEDYEAALALFKKRGRKTPDAVCFHAQQTAEKYLKAFLVTHKVKFSKTHDLLELLTLGSKVDPSLELIHDLLKRLNQYAVEFRYPGEDATLGEAKLAMQAAIEVRSVLRSKFA
ncbi:MAG: HEPN domain-containing protein [Elusimicrobia bacterium]|nr:HEPN domain-containing protein [Elusimicrobiota bacterium]